MSVVGLDFGTQNAVIAVARNKGVDVIANEVSNRATPSLVGFGPRCRYLGEAAKTQEVSNLKNTVGSLTRLAGRSINDPDVKIEQEHVSAPLVEVDGSVGAEVTFQGQKQRFSAAQLCAMFLTRVKQTAAAELKLPVSDMVIAVPAWYADAQRRIILDAASIAGIKVLRLINETTATALGYGITKLDLPAPEEKPRRTVIVDIGHSNYTCSVCEFRKGELKVVATACDRHFGGRDFDQALMKHFREDFQQRFKIDVFENPKARVRLAAAIEKLKKVLSANASAPLSIESLMNDVDVRAVLKRDELEELVAPLLQRATAPIKQALDEAKLRPDDVDYIELVGGCTRVPSLKAAIQNFFGGKSLSFTLNADEAVARGCAFSCAILSPTFRVRDFSIQDISYYPIEFTWEKSPDIPDEDTSLTVFNKGNVMPSTKILTFYRKQPFDLEARYAKPDILPGKMNPWIGRFSVKGVHPDESNDFMICKLKARLNLHGILNVEQGYYVEEQEVEEPVPEPKEQEVSHTHEYCCVSRLIWLQTAEGEDQPPAPKTRKVKKQIRKGDLALSVGTASLSHDLVDQYTEKEGQMVSDDKLVADTEDKKNELETEIYSVRNKVDEPYSSGGYAEFASESEKVAVKEKCEKLEDWLYEDGEDATKAQYIAKIEELRAAAGPIVQRFNDKRQEEEDARRKAAEKAAAEKRAAEDAAKAQQQQQQQQTADKDKDKDMPMEDAPADAEGQDPAEIQEAE
ncbi:heat shock protein 70 [Piedraia hortae CBS 480.64]|uniref:Heat shock protein 70 n=1 Tax=Piedraia hortae CBS 480.64 TaxID=1314780 RepID=A0A6A7C2E0_9PEZI|nr:heat shock protein 70 [Piedraia hortae CBS 480.64]